MTTDAAGAWTARRGLLTVLGAMSVAVVMATAWGATHAERAPAASVAGTHAKYTNRADGPLPK